jgi:hypothetical protein
MIETYTANNIHELFDKILYSSVNFKNQEPWWRGQSVSDWDLVSSIHRQDEMVDESSIMTRFKLKASTRRENCPSKDDLVGWLFLMQHYGLPTRLLDWSESPLIALFFAVEEIKYKNEDSAIWALNPEQLNRSQSNPNEGILLPNNERTIRSVYSAFGSNDKPPCEVLSLLPDHNDIRQMLQQSVFTIHENKTPINLLPKAESFLIKIIIPKEKKYFFKEFLDQIGIDRSSIFPDLENLAKYISERNFFMAPKK